MVDDEAGDASVSRLAGTPCSVIVIAPIIVGAMASPPTTSTTAISGTDSTKISGTMASAIAAEPQRRRTSGPLRHAIAPVTSPAIRLPTAQAASSQPAAQRMPCSSAKATVVTSAAPKSAPRVRQTIARVSTSRHGIGSRAPDSSRRPAGGSVRRWAANARVPIRPLTAAVVRPATGCQDVARIVTSTGPTTKTTSSSTASSAKAVCTSAGRSSRCAHRVRTLAPTWGSDAPARAAKR